MLSPLDDRLIKEIKTNRTKIYNTSITNQPSLGDFYSLNPTDYTYNADNVIQTTASEIIRYKKGDKLFARQNSLDKYFYVVGVNTSTNRLTVTGGNQYTFTNHSVVEIRLYIRGVGFPDYFTFAPGLAPIASTLSSISYIARTFSVNDDLVTLFLNTTFTADGAGTPGIIIDIPVNGLLYTSGGTWIAGNAFIETSDGPAQSVEPVYFDGASGNSTIRVYAVGYPLSGLFFVGSCSINATIVYRMA